MPDVEVRDALAALLEKIGVRRVNMMPADARFGKIVSREQFAELLAAEGVTLAAPPASEAAPSGQWQVGRGAHDWYVYHEGGRPRFDGLTEREARDVRDALNRLARPDGGTETP